MFYIRPARLDDAETLFKLSKMVHFINLPADRGIINEKIQRSRDSFRRAAEGDYSKPPADEHAPSSMSGLSESTSRTNLYMFVLEEEGGGPLGTSQLIASMGGPHSPNVSLKLEKRELYSTSLKFGTTQMVARMHLDETSPSEIGGLILQPSFRGHPARLGKFLGLIRFHFLALHRDGFADEMLAEMMGPTSPDGENLFWDFVGRRFIPLSYGEADRFCQFSREFMTSLMPRGDIYLSLLPPEARSVVGETGKETLPARKMLERMGFKYQNFVDPFDAGPNLRAKTDDISVVRDTRCLPFAGVAAASKLRGHAMVSVLRADGEFRAVHEPAIVDTAGVHLSKRAAEVLEIDAGAEVGFTWTREPVDRKAKGKPAAKAGPKAPGKRAGSPARKAAGGKDSAASVVPAGARKRGRKATSA